MSRLCVHRSPADLLSFEHSFLARTATRIVNEVRGINRVVYGITSKPPARLSGSEGQAAAISLLDE